LGGEMTMVFCWSMAMVLSGAAAAAADKLAESASASGEKKRNAVDSSGRRVRRKGMRVEQSDKPAAAIAAADPVVRCRCVGDDETDRKRHTTAGQSQRMRGKNATPSRTLIQ
jgi:hypothetical protein